MKSTFRDRFLEDVSTITGKILLRRIEVIIGKVETATSLRQIPQVKKLSGSDNAYRIRIGDYRIGFFLGKDDVVEFTRVLHRKEMYRFFP